MRTHISPSPAARWLRPLAILGAAATVLVAASTADAATTVYTSGKRGYFAISDTTGSPGARCVYSPPDGTGYAYLNSMVVRPPVVRARDITAARDRQLVSWRALVQTSLDPAGPWTHKGAGPWVTAAAYDNTAAPFVARAVSSPTNFTGYARVIVQIRWIRGGVTEGRISAVVNRYNVTWTVGMPNYVYSRPCDTRPD